MASCAVPTTDHELDPIGVEPASTQDVRGEGRARLDGHRDAALQLVQLDLRGDVAGEDLQISDQTGRRQAEVVVESIDFLRPLVGDQGAGGRTAICGEHHAVLANETQRRRAGLDFLGNRYHSYTPVQKGVKNDSRSIRPALFKNYPLRRINTKERGRSGRATVPRRRLPPRYRSAAWLRNTDASLPPSRRR